MSVADAVDGTRTAFHLVAERKYQRLQGCAEVWLDPRPLMQPGDMGSINDKYRDRIGTIRRALERCEADIVEMIRSPQEII